jgi:hypothetical protein
MSYDTGIKLAFSLINVGAGDFSKGNLQSGINEATSNMFTPDNIKEVTKSIALGEDPQNVIKRTSNQNTTGSTNRDVFNNEVGKGIGDSISKSFIRSKNLGGLTSALAGGFNLDNAGNIAQRIGGGLFNAFTNAGNAIGGMVGDAANSVKGWGEDIFGLSDFSKESSSNTLELARGVTEQFTPTAPAVQSAADSVAKIVQDGVDTFVEGDLNNAGKFGYNMLSGNWDKGFNNASAGFSDLSNKLNDSFNNFNKNFNRNGQET